MKRVRVLRYQCEYCRRLFPRKGRAERHETHCFKRDDREPWPGEITSARSEGTLVDYGEEPFGGNAPPGLSWFEWTEHKEMPSWWPGAGKIWDGGQWLDLAHYSVEEVRGAHGCAGGAGPMDAWPVVWRHGDLVPINEVKPASRRLDYLDRLSPPATSTEPSGAQFDADRRRDEFSLTVVEAAVLGLISERRRSHDEMIALCGDSVAQTLDSLTCKGKVEFIYGEWVALEGGK